MILVLIHKKSKPTRIFAVHLDELWCGYGKIQKLHLPCSYMLVACKYAQHDRQRYTTPM